MGGGFSHPLSAVYRHGLRDVIEALLAADACGPCFSSTQWRRVEERELRDVDPQLATLKNLNHPADYLAALEQAGYPASADLRQMLERDHSDE